ncbi:tropomyosin isoforms a/b/d/f [Ceratina calcarata]|uniref:Tropomyosin isoforms a/b/d/f n=1 Tax=Ceratina calcarata TaxID=156304 RepID=A0AAJ7NE40_9HYME|nr:tropomyosin isoforms a/b/d/f [Ceratina calcarata]
MSDNQALESIAEPSSHLLETTKLDQLDNAKNTAATDIENSAASVENQDVPMQNTECNLPIRTESEAIEISSRERNSTVVAEVTKSIDETVNESTEKIKAEDNEAASEPKQNDRYPSISEIEGQAAIGAGDTCFVTRRDGNVAAAQKSEEQITVTSAIEQIRPESEKAFAENDKAATDVEFTISKLKEEVQRTCDERDCYQKKFEIMEQKLNELQVSYDALLKGEGNEVMLRRMVDQLKDKLIQTSLQLEDRIRTVSNQEKQISALNSQVASLKEVETLTRSLLQIRNMEVKHLQAEVDDMEVRINEERERYNTMINKMDAAVKLNADLKKEYETQLTLFRDLREKYEEKVSLLSEEKRALEANTQPVSK